MLLYPRYNAPVGALRHSVALAVQPLSGSQQLAPGDGLPHRHRCKAALDLNGEYFPVRTGVQALPGRRLPHGLGLGGRALDGKAAARKVQADPAEHLTAAQSLCLRGLQQRLCQEHALMNAAVRQKPAHGGLQTGVHRAKVDAPDKAAQRPHQQQKQHGPRGQPGAGLQQALRVLSRAAAGGHGKRPAAVPRDFL